MIKVGHWYYASTPRTEPRKMLERVRVLVIYDGKAQVETCRPILTNEVYTIPLDKIKE